MDTQEQLARLIRMMELLHEECDTLQWSLELNDAIDDVNEMIEELNDDE